MGVKSTQFFETQKGCHIGNLFFTVINRKASGVVVQAWKWYFEIEVHNEIIYEVQAEASRVKNLQFNEKFDGCYIREQLFSVQEMGKYHLG